MCTQYTICTVQPSSEDDLVTRAAGPWLHSWALLIVCCKFNTMSAITDTPIYISVGSTVPSPWLPQKGKATWKSRPNMQRLRLSWVCFLYNRHRCISSVLTGDHFVQLTITVLHQYKAMYTCTSCTLSQSHIPRLKWTRRTSTSTSPWLQCIRL